MLEMWQGSQDRAGGGQGDGKAMAAATSTADKTPLMVVSGMASIGS